MLGAPPTREARYTTYYPDSLVATRKMLRSFFWIAACFWVYSLAGPSHHNGRPTVQIRNGTVLGNSTGGIDGFFGIPYAKPPLSELRLRPPQTIDQSYGSLVLPGSIDQVAACTQMTLSTLNLSDTTSIPENNQAAYYDTIGTSPNIFQQEDCLTLNIFRPAGVPADKKLPVLFWIYGGGWEIGTTQWYDASPIVNLSISMNEPIVFVSVNYRLNAFGFLQGKELQAEGGTNIGLRDQRKAMEWVAENIAAFGGNPNQITIWVRMRTFAVSIAC
jgi:carboxylesterase type B